MKLVVLTALLSFWGAAQAQSTQSGPFPIPDDYFLRDSVPLNVQPVMDEDNRYSDTIGPEGGQLVTLDAAGNTYTLTVPKGALSFPEQLSMTPLSDLKGMPFKKGLNVGVQLEPEGTFFVKPVTLEITFAKTPDLNTITPFDYTGKGQDFTTTMLKPDPGHFVFVLNHFSGVGFGNANAAERTAELVRQPLDAVERISQSVRQAIAAAHVEQVRAEELGQVADPQIQDAIIKAMGEAVEAFDQEVLKPLEQAANTSCTAGRLYVNEVLGMERQIQLVVGSAPAEGQEDPAIESLPGMEKIRKFQGHHDFNEAAYALSGSIAKQCLEEEAQVCYKTGDLARFVRFNLALERQVELLSAQNLGPKFESEFATAYNACSHFEVQFNSTLIQKGAVKLDVGFIGGTLNTDYRAAITSILPIASRSGGQLVDADQRSLLPYGKQLLPYASYALKETTNSQVAVATTADGTLGVKGNCTVEGTGTVPGQLSVLFFPAFMPPDINAPDPTLNGLSPAQKRDVMRIFQHTPKLGLLEPPQQLDLKNSLLEISVGQPREHAQSTCNEEHVSKSEEYTTWLEVWSEQLKAIGKAVTVVTGDMNDEKPAWDLTKWQKQTSPAFPLKIVQDVPKHEEVGGSSFDETWHLDITVVHTPQVSKP